MTGSDFEAHINNYYYNPITIASDFSIPMEGFLSSLYNLYPSFYTYLNDVDEFLEFFGNIEGVSENLLNRNFHKNFLAFVVTMTNKHPANPKVCSIDRFH